MIRTRPYQHRIAKFRVGCRTEQIFFGINHGRESLDTNKVRVGHMPEDIEVDSDTDAGVVGWLQV